MSQHDDDSHGSSPAAWTAVGIMCIASLIIGIGFVMVSLPVIIVGTVVFLGGILAGQAMRAKGLGAHPPVPREPLTLD